MNPEPTTAHTFPDDECAHHPSSGKQTAPEPHAGHDMHGAHAGHHGSGWKAAAHITAHCLTGCAIGEFIGLAIGVSAGFAVHYTIALAVALSFVSGFALTLLPLLRDGLGFATAFATIWLGEAVSIGTMELVMNLVDYQMGGMRGTSLVSGRYWASFALALVLGFVAAWPVNRWMLARNVKRCH